MPAYAIFIREGAITDMAAMEAYRGANRTVVPTVPIKPLVVYGKTEALEGEAPDGMVILEFADMEAARTWYWSDDYQDAAKLRMKAANYRAFLVEGWNP